MHVTLGEISLFFSRGVRCHCKLCDGRLIRMENCLFCRRIPNAHGCFFRRCVDLPFTVSSSVKGFNWEEVPFFCVKWCIIITGIIHTVRKNRINSIVRICKKKMIACEGRLTKLLHDKYANIFFPSSAFKLPSEKEIVRPSQLSDGAGA